MSSGRPAHLRIEGVVKRFRPGAAAAVDGVSLDIAAGEFFALLGPSGCGKTTLLRLLAGFERPDAGRILIDGEDMAAIAPYRRPVNMMFQSYALFPHMTVAENVGFGLRQDRLPKAERAARVAAMLDLVKLAPLAERKPQQLSGGERQRVALARALAQEPKLVLLDEPLAALDRKLREETRFELVRIQQRIGITFLMVTHDQEEAMSMASRIAVMAAGKVVQLGTPQDIYETPQSRFVADFIGGVNLFEGKVFGGSEGTVVVWSEEAGVRILAEHAPLKPATTVTLAVRPEKIALNPSATLGNRLEGIIRGHAYRGESSSFEIELANAKVVRVSVANSARQPQPYGIGERVTLGWDPADTVVLTQ